MENLHAPTVPSGPTSDAATNGNTTHLSFNQLQCKKNDVEAQLRTLGSVLDSHGVTMETALLTRDGFPRSDIDVAQIRTTRAQIIRLRNDYKEIMKSIEKHLHEHFASLNDAPAPAAGESLPSEPLPDSIPEQLDPTFARVNTVAPNSPAEAAGLKPNDEIRSFGWVKRSNHDNLRKVGEVVQANEGSDIVIRVTRSLGSVQTSDQRWEELRLTLRPKRDWGGRGTLGCHIIPI
ncbi:uncharacterized protein F5Z01DRAFT_647453 [Emericellopsis atlantica]|uniref:Probable 26S proteasome regulatory subunit p27 n=1 Tax=Emericellopsis atlantica TaxID=2614577 RepID=A0A9P7ZSK2_9HYPO|nr:uncharacterized protein F5Z01DRAFT_647453 [Emericellopsis atlantica]KAG9257031.1 hypothetical protein F5Z01DRAFT_647453 [Emericellopsis atlantica]